MTLPADGPAWSDRVVLVAAVADNGVIGVEGRLPWHLPGELAHFKRVTLGHTVVMGRRTFESIGRPLPRRTNVVVTRQPDWTAEGVVVAHDVESALALAAQHPGDVMVIGGGEVYAQAMPLAGRQILTRVHAAPEGDAHYPEVDADAWEETAREPGEGYDVVWLRRRAPGRADAEHPER